MNDPELLIPENMIQLYARGAFPMADESGILDWYLPEIRTIIPIQNYNYPRSLRKFMETSELRYTYDRNTMEVVSRCAAREETWISGELVEAYRGLYNNGYLHSVEVLEGKKLVGGLYGVAYNGAFFGESMFSEVSQASKAALIKLLERLSEKGFILLDVQFMTEHLRMFGAKQISWNSYTGLLSKARRTEVTF